MASDEMAEFLRENFPPPASWGTLPTPREHAVLSLDGMSGGRRDLRAKRLNYWNGSR